MKKIFIPLGAILAAVLIGVLIWQSSSANSPGPSPSAAASAPTVLPVTANPISGTGAKTGLSITAAMAEDNVDPATKAAIGDRLQFTLTNSADTPLTGLEVYYTMKDTTTGATESYYQKLHGLTLPPGQGTTVYFDNGNGTGHYPENQYSLYRSSTNEVQINIEAAAPGYAPAHASATKAQGTGEKAD